MQNQDQNQDQNQNLEVSQNQPIEQNQGLTKKQRYLIRKQRKEQAKIKMAKVKKVKKILKIIVPIVAVVAVIVILVVVLPGSSNRSAQEVGAIEIIEAEYDAGTVSISSGLVEHTFEIKNTGVDNLEISRIWTSCMCTKASLKVGEKESEAFGMHSNPLFWSQEIAPGETGYLNVSFDPMFHGPTGTGNMVREAYLTTNDPNNKKARVKMTINVIP